MKTTTLGHTDISANVIGLGCMGMSAFYGPTDEAESIKTIHRALELGVNFFDTSISYGIQNGDNERLLKKALVDAGKRDQAIICTKFGFSLSDDDPDLDGSPENCFRRCDESLQALGVDVIDLYYIHRVDPNVPVEETVGAMVELVQQGKIRAIGLSATTAENVRRASTVHPISALQSEYNLWRRDVEGDILDTCRELGVSLVAYSPLGRGFLTGKITAFEQLTDDDWRRTSMHQFMVDDINDRIQHNAQVITALATAKNCTPAQIALAWVHAQGDDIITIAGTKRRAYLEENIASQHIVLTSDELQQLNNIQHMEIVTPK